MSMCLWVRAHDHLDSLADIFAKIFQLLRQDDERSRIQPLIVVVISQLVQNSELLNEECFHVGRALHEDVPTMLVFRAELWVTLVDRPYHHLRVETYDLALILDKSNKINSAIDSEEMKTFSLQILDDRGLLEALVGLEVLKRSLCDHLQ